MTERHQVPVRWCLTHGCEASGAPFTRCHEARARFIFKACRLVPLFYETEGDNPQ